ncbi:hypothetical protein HYDPIDRAFT_33271 [Hydnomerulius pinastri MD-312]|uniref:Uncharacterized protein n=1 Tax=Hydnomerulius pinastri MD-312 TaxID=994086 RepID=A0A0C9W934_9AGAM|nr:hypothetical protein HYDPIDRAFT_33271 [Hydnomerulius pinastri MD-312]
MDNLFNLNSSLLKYTDHFPFDQPMDMGAANEQPPIQIDHDLVGWYMVTVPLSPIHSPIPSTTILVEMVNPQNISYNPGRGQDLMQHLTNVGTPCWVLVALELNNLLWVHMLTSPMGNIPSKNLFNQLLGATIACCLKLDRLAPGSSRPHFAHRHLQKTPPLRCQRDDKDYYREYILQRRPKVIEAYLQVLRIIPSSIEPPFIEIIPLPTHCTPEVRTQLRMGLMFSLEVGVRLLHQVLPATLNSEPMFRWFRNTTLPVILQHALYDPTFAGWYGFMCDVHGFDGLPYWIPLGEATNFQVAYVISWYIYALDLHLRSYANVRGVLVDYAVLPTTLPSRERVNEVNTRVKKLKKYFNSVVDRVPGCTVEEQHEICLSYTDFQSRPSHLPFHTSVNIMTGAAQSEPSVPQHTVASTPIDLPLKAEGGIKGRESPSTSQPVPSSRSTSPSTASCTSDGGDIHHRCTVFNINFKRSYSGKVFSSSGMVVSPQQKKANIWHQALLKKKALALQMLETQKVIEGVEDEVVRHLTRDTISHLRCKVYSISDDTTFDG